jgi:hypothetical protein
MFNNKEFCCHTSNSTALKWQACWLLTLQFVKAVDNMLQLCVPAGTSDVEFSEAPSPEQLEEAEQQQQQQQQQRQQPPQHSSAGETQQ